MYLQKWITSGDYQQDVTFTPSLRARERTSVVCPVGTSYKTAQLWKMN